MSSYHRVVAAAALANLGDGIRIVALPLLAAAITRDPTLVSGLTVAAYLPWVLFALPIGALIDRGRPETFMAIANLGRAVLLAGMVLVGADSIVLLYVMAFLLGIGEAAYDTAAQSLIPKIVTDAQLEKANSALVTAERLGQDLAGPAVGGALFAASMMLPFGLNAAGLAVAGVLLIGIRTSRGTPPVSRGLLSDAFDGLRWLMRPHLVRTVILTGAAMNFFTLAWESVLVLLATGPIGMSETGYGIMLAAGAVGGVAGAMATPALVRRFDQRNLQISVLVVCALVDLALAAFPSAITAAIAWGGTGGAFAVWSVVSVTLRQRLVPAEMLGRVNSANRIIGMTACPLGALAGGLIAAVSDLRTPIWGAGLAMAALAVVFALRTRSAEMQTV